MHTLRPVADAEFSPRGYENKNVLFGIWTWDLKTELRTPQPLSHPLILCLEGSKSIYTHKIFEVPYMQCNFLRRTPAAPLDPPECHILILFFFFYSILFYFLSFFHYLSQETSFSFKTKRHLQVTASFILVIFIWFWLTLSSLKRSLNARSNQLIKRSNGSPNSSLLRSPTAEQSRRPCSSTFFGRRRKAGWRRGLKWWVFVDGVRWSEEEDGGGCRLFDVLAMVSLLCYGEFFFS